MASSTLMKGESDEKYVLMKRQLDEMTKRNEHLVNDLDQANKRLRRLAHEKSNILLDRITIKNTGTDDDVLQAIKKDDDLSHASPRPSQSLDAQPPPLIKEPPTTTSTALSSNDITPVTPMPALRSDHTLPSLTSSITLPPPAPTLKKPIPLPPTSSLLPPTPTPPSPPRHPGLPTAQPLPPTAPISELPIISSKRGSAFKDVTLPSITDDNLPPYNISSSLDPSASNCTMVPSSRPKRMRRGNQEPKLRRVQPLQRDPSGRYRLPVRVGILTVHALGRIVPLTTYHNDRYIWPPGFRVSRTYLSMIHADQNTVYTCTVEENGEQGPRFRVVAEDCPDQPIVANSATGVWTAIVKRANEIRNREHSNSASGPDYYGFTHATIAKMIQDLPGADQCLNYVWQKFGEMHHRTAAGVAAAAQKKLANLEIMGSANKRAPPPLSDGFVLHDNYHKPITYSPSSSSASSTSSNSSSFKAIVKHKRRRRDDDPTLTSHQDDKGFMRMKLSPPHPHPHRPTTSLPANTLPPTLPTSTITSSPVLPSLSAITHPISSSVESHESHPIPPSLPPPTSTSWSNRP
ncbi:hypothetical protein DM01DRAFT_1384128 [Hesseltinella vesiculosa]|uniref:FYR N-terminal domain-containing protein n=1 Tax=Hesseltinella vesiculosa TaxID=101127 RepID=A0A1X2GG96_9FUNG|nr:hypothetical protein DM01DRAFT_1384128 [Hesseltinella vesiculosa]